MEIDKICLLLVEDDFIIATNQKSLLESKFDKVHIALSGANAITTFTEHPDIDLVLMDIVLDHGENGFKTAAALLAIRDVPIMYLTDVTEPELLEKTKELPTYGLLPKGSAQAILVSSIVLALNLFKARTRQKQQEVELNRQKNLLDTIMMSATDVIYAKDTEGRYLAINHAGARILGRPVAEIIGQTHDQLFPETHHESNNATDVSFRYVMSTGNTHESEWEVELEGKRLTYNIKKSPWKNQSGEIIGVVAVGVDITQHIWLEDALQQTNQFKDHILQSTNEGVVVLSADFRCQLWNSQMQTITGKPASQVIGKYLWEVLPHFSPEHCKERYSAVLGGGNAPPLLLPFTFADSAVEGWVSIDAAPLRNSRGRITGIIETIRDITERKKAEDKITALIVEKELLLQEVHHRIKNNMNTINGLLLLQAASLQDTTAIDALKESASRVRGMMLLYDKLYRNDGYTSMSAAAFIPQLIDEIVNSFPKGRQVTVNKEIATTELSVQKLQPLSIIINELITNIMKYGFIGGGNYNLTVRLATAENGWISLEIHDDGIQMPETLDLDNPNGFGLKLVKMLVKQLEGSLRIERVNGTRRIVGFCV